jgi:hypothetical protein
MRTNSIFIAHVLRQWAARSAADGAGVADFPGFTPGPGAGHGPGTASVTRTGEVRFPMPMPRARLFQ